MDRAGVAYWNRVWAETDLPTQVPANRRDRAFADYFRRHITPGPLLEVGCADSAWLPYFALELGCQVTGLDYSPQGCDQARAILARARIEAEVVCADLFDPPPELRGRFDTVVTIGVVEHFDDTKAVVQALARFVAPGGRLVTMIPNLTGVIGTLQRRMNPAVYRLHVPLTPAALEAAHHPHKAHATYLMSTGFGVLNLNGIPDAPKRDRVVRTLSRASKAVWAIEDRTRPLPATRLFAPYTACVCEVMASSTAG